MNEKWPWLVVVFAVGIGMGVWLSRSKRAEPPATDTAAVASPVNATPVAAAQAAPGLASMTPREPREAALAAAPVSSASSAGSADAGYPVAIDVGPVFGKSFEPKPVPGTPDPLVEAHRELEREARDDSWSYAMEAEIQNSLLAETSAGSFNLEHVECRASMCEIRLSGNASQAEALQRWADGVHSEPWGSRLQPSVASMINENGKVDRILILRRPPKPAKAN